MGVGTGLYMYDVVVKKVHVCYLISWWVLMIICMRWYLTNLAWKYLFMPPKCRFWGHYTLQMGNSLTATPKRALPRPCIETRHTGTMYKSLRSVRLCTVEMGRSLANPKGRSIRSNVCLGSAPQRVTIRPNFGKNLASLTGVASLRLRRTSYQHTSTVQ